MRSVRSSCLPVVVALVLLPSTSQAQVFYGVVRDRESSQPVLVAAVLLVDYFDKVRRLGTTDSAGRYVLVAPGPGRYKVRADARGYRPVYTGEYIVEAGDTVQVDILVSTAGEQPGVTATRRRALAPGCVPTPAPGGEPPPAACDGRWEVEVFNCFDQPIRVYDSSTDEPVLLGEVAAREYRVLAAEGSAKPVVTLRPDEGWYPADFRNRSLGLISVNVYCDRSPRSP